MKKLLAVVALLAATAGLAGGTPASADPSPSASASASATPGHRMLTAAPAPTLRHGAAADPTPTPSASGTTVQTTVGPQRILLEGDSITAGWLLAPQYRLEADLATYLGVPAPTIVNHAIGGQLLMGPNGLASIWDAQIATLAPGDVVYLQIGTNDLFTYAGDAAFTSTYAGMVQRALALGLRVVVGLITPVSPDHWNVEVLRQRLNQWLKDAFGSLTNDSPAVLHNATTGATWMEPRFGWSVNGSPDGIHLNEGGQAVLAYSLAAHIRASGWWPTA